LFHDPNNSAIINGACGVFSKQPPIAAAGVIDRLRTGNKPTERARALSFAKSTIIAFRAGSPISRKHRSQKQLSAAQSFDAKITAMEIGETRKGSDYKGLASNAVSYFTRAR